MADPDSRMRERLVLIGSNARNNLPEAVRQIYQLGLTWGQQYFGLTPSTTETLLTSRTSADLVALARSLAIVDAMPGLCSGSVAAVIWVFHELERRGYDQLLSLAEWIMTVDKNDYVPFGTMAHKRERLAELRHRDAAREMQVSINIKREYLISQFGADAYDQQLNAWLDERYSLLRRNAEQLAALQESNRTRRDEYAKFERTVDQIVGDLTKVKRAVRQTARQWLIERGTALDISGRLQLISENRGMPIAAFPGSWASDDLAVLSAMDPGVREYFMHGIAKVRQGPWCRMYRALCQTC